MWWRLRISHKPDQQLLFRRLIISAAPFLAPHKATAYLPQLNPLIDHSAPANSTRREFGLVKCRQVRQPVPADGIMAER